MKDIETTTTFLDDLLAEVEVKQEKQTQHIMI